MKARLQPNFRRAVNDLHAVLFDWRFGVRTRQWMLVDELTGDVPAKMDANRYEPSTTRQFRRAIRSCQIEPAHYLFVDVGSGLGKTLLLAEQAGFRHMVGVEFSGELVDRAEMNIKAYCSRRRTAQREQFTLVRADALDYKLPDEPTLIYMFNPFGEETMHRFSARLDPALLARSAPLTLVYVNPVHANILDELKFLERLHSDERIALYRMELTDR